MPAMLSTDFTLKKEKKHNQSCTVAESNQIIVIRLTSFIIINFNLIKNGGKQHFD